MSEPQDVWDPMESAIKIFGNQPTATDFQNLTVKLIDEKCWTAQDVSEFLAILSELDKMNVAQTKEESMEMLLNTEYRDNILKLLKKLDTMNVVCAYKGRCDSISSEFYREEMVRFVNTINQIIELYEPVLIELSNQLNKTIKHTSNECKLDPAYSELLVDTRNKLFKLLGTQNELVETVEPVEPVETIEPVKTEIAYPTYTSSNPTDNFFYVGIFVIVILAILVWIRQNRQVVTNE